MRISASSLPRIQVFGMVVIVLVSILSVSGFFLFQTYLNTSDRLDNLRHAVTAQQYAGIRSEVSTAMQYIDHMRSRSEQVLQDGSREHVEHAFNTAMAIYEREKGKRSDEQIKGLIRDALRHVRFFHQRGYLFILSEKGEAILLPTQPELEGSDFSVNTDDTGAYILPKLMEATDNIQASGYATYRWYPPGYGRMAEKVSYVKRFEPYGWLIGGGDYRYLIEQDLQQVTLKQLSEQRFGQNGYFAVITNTGKVLSNPSTPQLDGLEFGQLPEKASKVVSHLLKVAERGGGFTEYEWRLRDKDKTASKVSFVQPIEGWNWIIIAGVYPEDIDLLLDEQVSSFEQSLADNGLYLLIAALIGVIVTFAVGTFFARWSHRLFNEYQQKIDKKQQQLLVASRVFDAATEGVMVTSPENNIVAVNKAFEQITGYKESEVLGKNPSILSSGTHDDDFYKDMWEQLNSVGSWQGEISNRRRDGRLYPEWISISVSKDEQDSVINYIATLSDISERKRTEERLRYLSEYDTMTDLPNRSLLMDRVSQAIAQSKRYGGQIALIHIDLDRFKNINDSYSHQIGDRVLQEVSRRLAANARASDTVARMGGDGFAVLMTEIDSPASVAALISRTMEVISDPIYLEAHTINLHCSVGIAMYPLDGEDFDALLCNADTALHHVKNSGRKDFQFFTAEMNQRVSQRLELERGLRKALLNQEFELYYQPQFNLQDNCLVGCEALIRWNHPVQGLISPMTFIPVAEESGLINQIGNWVLFAACEQAKQWIDKGVDQITVAVNLSAHQFRDDLLTTVKHVLEQTGLPASSLELEVTETVLMEDIDRSAQVLNELREIGIKIALDDFGTGYSSLSYLKQFPLDKLKIDRSFIMGLPEDEGGRVLAASIIDIAQNMQLDTVAEGVETEQQQQFLLEEGCLIGQGYLYSKPLPVEGFETVLTGFEAECLQKV